MKITSITAVKFFYFDGTVFNVFDESIVFPDPEKPPCCPLCQDNRNIWVHALVEQAGFWDTVMVALCHCGWCNGEFAVRRIDGGNYDVGEESQSVLPLGGCPELIPATLKSVSKAQ